MCSPAAFLARYRAAQGGSLCFVKIATSNSGGLAFASFEQHLPSGRVTHETRLVARKRELALVQRALELSRHEPQIVEIAGEPGIGKTRLVAEVLKGLESSDAVTLVGRGSELEQDLPFGVFVDAFENEAPMVQEQLEFLDDHELAALASAIPVLVPSVGGSAEHVERYETLRVIRRLLELLASRKQTVLIIDDVHWADPASIELLAYLTRRPPRGRILLLLAHRARHARVESGIRDALPDDSGFTRIELLPLSEQEAREFLGASIDDELFKALYRESGGIPFYLEQLARGGSHHVQKTHGVVRPLAEGIPHTVLNSIAAEVRSLSPDARLFCLGAAIVGEPFEPFLAAVAAELDESTALLALDEVLEHDLVRPAQDPSRFRFRHPIVRRAVYETAMAGWRLSAHERVARALRDRGASPLIQAHHVERSAHGGDREAIALLESAGHAAAPRAPATAAKWFEAAIQLIPYNDDTDRRTSLLVPLATALGSAGRIEESRDVLHEVLDLLTPDMTDLRVRAVTFTAIVDSLLGNHEEARGIVEQELVALGSDNGRHVMELKCHLSYGCFYTADWESMCRWATEALAQDADDLSLHSFALSNLALGRFGLSDIRGAEAAATEAAQLIDALSDRALASRLESVACLGWVEHCTGRHEDALRHMDRAIAVSRKTGQHYMLVAFLVVRAMALADQGRLADAVETAEAAIESSLLSDNKLFLTWAYTTRCLLELQVGTSKAALEFGKRAASVGASTRSPWAEVARWYLANALLEQGEVEQSRRHATSPDGSLSMPPSPLYAGMCFDICARLDLQAGNLAAAKSWAAQSMEMAQESGLESHIVAALRTGALVELELGNAAGASELALESAVLADDSRRPLEAARSRQLAGKALIAQGHHDQAAEQLKRAHAEFSDYGALRYRNEVAQELRGLGLSPSPPPRAVSSTTSLGALTGRELEVADLVAAGKTNRAIADDLYLSVKTVDRHLSRIFGKLNVSSRAALASLVERSRIASGT